MRAAYCTAPGRLEIRECPTPAPGPGEVLVRVRHCGICGSDLHWFGGGFPAPAVCPGHEICGEVAEAGAGVAGWSPGDRVAVEPLVTCRECPECLSGNYQLCRRIEILGNMRDGGFADFVLAPAYSLFRLPRQLDLEIGALTEPTAVCVHAVRLGALKPGGHVLVLGAGSIGLLAVLAARAAGAGEVSVSARHPHQREMAVRLGATRAFATDAEGEAARRDYTNEHPVDVVLETVGGEADTINEAMYAVRRGGTVVVLGVFSSMPSCNAILLVVKEIRLIGSMTYGRGPQGADFERAIDILQANADAVAPMITHRRGLAEIQQGFEAAANKQSGAIKVMIAP